MATAIVNSLSSFTKLYSDLMTEWQSHKYLRISWTTKRSRSLDQNALWASMYQRISDTVGDGTAYDCAAIKCYLKLHLGVPILRRDSPAFQELYDKVVKRHDYETKLKMMELLPVTSVFNTAQGAEFTTAILKHYFDAGIEISFSDLLEQKHAA